MKGYNNASAWLKAIGGVAIITVHTFITIGLMNLYFEEGIAIGSILAFIVGFLPTIIAMIKKSPDLSRIFLWNLLFFPLADLFLLTEEPKVKEKFKKDEFICESCNETFGLPEKTNKFLKICGLLLIYGFILYLIESIPTDNVSNLLSRFILDMAFMIIAIVHVLITIFKDPGRGKCPYCGSSDFISINSVKGKNLLKEVKKIQTQTNK